MARRSDHEDGSPGVVQNGFGDQAVGPRLAPPLPWPVMMRRSICRAPSVTAVRLRPKAPVFEV